MIKLRKHWQYSSPLLKLDSIMTQPSPDTPANPYSDLKRVQETPKLQSIVVLHKVISIWIVFYILTYLIGLLSQLVFPPELAQLIMFSLLVLGFIGSILVFRLASKLGGVVIGIAYGIVSLIPCLGLICLFVINGQAMAYLRENGISTGFGNENPKPKSKP